MIRQYSILCSREELCLAYATFQHLLKALNYPEKIMDTSGVDATPVYFSSHL